ncbi:Tectonic-2 [Liparis tanakae]|uniref:Tectonic-2 n=1 Tax=Liparis tanakae TaxID=230148 RepID=A0A4Z2GHM1_9TELE|nr:Tectonic-2 [Liparis tanakae]
MFPYILTVFQPSRVTATGPTITALLLGDSTDISLNLRTVSPSNTTGQISSPLCESDVTQWVLTTEQLGKNAVRVQLRLERNLRLCGDNETDAACCSKPLCVLETLQVSACVNGTPRASLLIQAKIYALLLPENAGTDNKTLIPNQVYQPMGSCPCDLTSRACDVRCCCDKDCSMEDLKLFVSQCLPGPFGGRVSPTPDYHCSAQSSENSPDWFPFLCVNSPRDLEVDVIDEVANDMSLFMSSTDATSDEGLVCENVTLALDYKFYWKGNGITNITLTRIVGTITLNTSVTLTTRYSAVFLNGELMGEPNSGNPGYQVGRPVIAGTLDLLDNNTGSVQRTPINVWKPVSDGLCSTAEMKPVLFGENSTSGCLLPVSRQNLTQCDLLREAVTALQAALVEATYVAKSGNPNPLAMSDWLNISFVTLNSSTTMEDTTSSCRGVPSHQHIHVRSRITGMVQGIPQKDISVLQVSFSLSSWTMDCGGGDVSLCMNPLETKLFPITSSVTFTDIPINTGPPQTRFQVNFTEYDCNRNDVCWPELAFPMTTYYTGEPYSQSLAKGLILVFFFITASILGTPWRQIRQAWT